MELKTPLAGARGLGSAKSGSGHWWLQRVTAVALVPLSFWFFALMELVFKADYAAITAWINAPLNGACIIAWILAVFYHAALGVQVVIEDYVSGEWQKIVSVWAANLLFFFLGLMALVAVLRIITTG